MASGKPIIGVINGSCANFIVNNGIGYVCKSGDSEALAKLIKGLDLNKLKEIGEHSKKVYFKKYSKNIFIDRLAKYQIQCDASFTQQQCFTVVFTISLFGLFPNFRI